MVVVKVTSTAGEKYEYYMDAWLKKQIDEGIIKSLQKKDEDYVLVVDGAERAGKSTLAMQIGRYVDKDLDLSKICFTPEEFRTAIIKAKKGSCIIFDEAFKGFSSRGVLSFVNKILIGLMQEMGQKNLLVIIVLPTYFMLDKYVALWRARSLIHVSRVKGRRGYFTVFNKKLKKMLYLKGKVTYSYGGIRPPLGRGRGRFYGVCAVDESAYRKKKDKALKSSFKVSGMNLQDRFKRQRDMAWYALKNLNGFSCREIAEYYQDTFEERFKEETVLKGINNVKENFLKKEDVTSK